MSLANFTFPFGAANLAAPNWTPPTLSPLQTHATAVNSLLYGPEGHQGGGPQPNSGQYYQNDPYAPPGQPANTNQRQTYRHRQHHHFQYRSRNNYLPPATPQPSTPPSPPAEEHSNNNYLPPQTPIDVQSHSVAAFEQQTQQRTFSESTFSQQPEYGSPNVDGDGVERPPPISFETAVTPQSGPSSTPSPSDGGSYVPPTYTRVQAGQGAKTQVHAVLDYDNDEYYDEENVSGEPSVISFGRNAGSTNVSWKFPAPKMNWHYLWSVSLLLRAARKKSECARDADVLRSLYNDLVWSIRRRLSLLFPLWRIFRFGARHFRRTFNCRPVVKLIPTSSITIVIQERFGSIR